MNLGEQFTEYLDALPKTQNGYLNVPKELFTFLMNKVKTSEDIEHMKTVVADYYGHRNSINGRTFDEWLKYGLKIDAVAMLDFFRFHRQMFYYPHPDILDLYVDHFVSQEDYENNAKKFIEACTDEYWLKKTDKYYNNLIDCAYRHGDKASVESLYIDILDYNETKLNTHSINCVLDSVNSSNIALLEHINQYVAKHNIESDFSTHLLHAAHSTSKQDIMNKHINDAINYAQSSGNSTLIKSEKIKSELLAKFKNHNVNVQNMISAFGADKVLPEDPNFYEWSFEGTTPKSEDLKSEDAPSKENSPDYEAEIKEKANN